MKRASMFWALVIMGTLGLSATATAKDHDKDNDRHREVREIPHDRDRHESRAHERHEFAAREHHEDAKRAHERHEQQKQWAHYRDRDGKHDGRHEGWERGKHNPHHHDANLRHPAPTTAAAHPTQPGHGAYYHRPVNKPVHTDNTTHGQ